jgi:hypothetical protein
VAQVGVNAVGQGDVDNAVLTSEWDGRFGAIAGEGEEPFASTTGEKNTKGISHSTNYLTAESLRGRIVFVSAQRPAS